MTRNHPRSYRSILAAAALLALVFPVRGDAGEIPVETNWHYQGRPAAAFDFGGSPGRPDATPARYLVAYESDNDLGRPLQIWGRLVQWNGVKLGMSGGDPSFDMSLDISNDFSVAHARPTVAFKFGRIDKPSRNYLVAWQRSDGSLGYRILDRAGGPLMPPAKIPGLIYQDVSAATAPSGGWKVSRCGTTFGCTPYLLAYRAWSYGATTGPVSSIRLAIVDDGTGALVSTSVVESYAPVDNPIYAPHIVYGHSASAPYFLLAYRRPSGEIVARKVTSTGGIGPAWSVTSSSNGPPVVAYSQASKRWAVFWRANGRGLSGGTSVAIQAKIYDADTLMKLAQLTAISAPLGDFGTAPGVLPEYSAAGSQTATSSSPFQGVFELSYILNGEVYSRQIYTGGTLGSTSRLTSNAIQDRYVKLATARIDPLTTSYPDPSTCLGTPGSRCALWVFERFYSSSDHDIAGYSTSSEY